MTHIYSKFFGSNCSNCYLKFQYLSIFGCFYCSSLGVLICQSQSGLFSQNCFGFCRYLICCLWYFLSVRGNIGRGQYLKKFIWIGGFHLKFYGLLRSNSFQICKCFGLFFEFFFGEFKDLRQASMKPCSFFLSVNLIQYYHFEVYCCCC